METRVARLKALAANDNNAAISPYLLEQLTGIMAFTAQKRRTSLNVMTASLCLALGVGSVGTLRDGQFRAALDYVLAYNAAMAA